MTEFTDAIDADAQEMARLRAENKRLRDLLRDLPPREYRIPAETFRSVKRLLAYDPEAPIKARWDEAARDGDAYVVQLSGEEAFDAAEGVVVAANDKETAKLLRSRE